MNNQLKQTYYAQIYTERIKEYYKREIHLGRLLPLQDLFERVNLETGIEWPSESEVVHSISKWYENIAGVTLLNSLTKDLSGEEFDEIMIFGNQEGLGLKGRLRQHLSLANFHLTEDDLQLLFDGLCLKYKQTWNFNSPFVSFNIQMEENSFRATLMHRCLSGSSSSRLFLRRIRPQTFKLADFIETESVSHLEHYIHQNENILVCGATGSGKTSLLDSLLKSIPPKEHVVILEDTLELGGHKISHTSMLSEANTPGKTLKDYCAYALRMRPDRIILGEIRSSEIVPFVLAMNTGHNGLMASLHANSAVEALERVALLFCLYSGQPNISYLQVYKMVTSNIGLIIYMQDKKIHSIIRLKGSDGERPIFDWVYQNAIAHTNENNELSYSH